MVRISGIGDGARMFAGELQTAMAHLPAMRFNYPDPTSVDVVQRDLTDTHAKLQRIKDDMARRLGKLGLDPQEEEARRSLLLGGRK